ncbi:hypothetical protein ACP70R_047958 [Stipagrostis hirtigluma subsp. patula]
MGWKAAEKLIRHWKILRGDNVMIIRGKDKGETGLIKRVIRSQNRVIVEGKNLEVGPTGVDAQTKKCIALGAPCQYDAMCKFFEGICGGKTTCLNTQCICCQVIGEDGVRRSMASLHIPANFECNAEQKAECDTITFP